MFKHVFFDLDNTLTRSHSRINAAHEDAFDELCAKKDVVVVTGGGAVDIRAQLTARFDGKYVLLAGSGGHAIDKKGTELWRGEISAQQEAAVLSFIEKMKRSFNVKVRDENDLVEHRGAQISYSVLGYHENVEKKYAFDPGVVKRKAMLAQYADDVERLRELGIETTPGGTTTFNFTPLGKDKGFNVARLIEREGWRKDECLYVGDALAPGENDFSVVGVIQTHAVKGPDETFDFIKKNLLM